MQFLQRRATSVALILIVTATLAFSAAPTSGLRARVVTPAHVEKPVPAVNAAYGEESPPHPAAIFGQVAFAFLIALASVGSIFCLPIPRAWLLALCGNYAAATEIYENQLARKPNHLPLYLTLANLYLLAGRQDERALIAYRMVWQLRMATHHLQASKRLDLSPRRTGQRIKIFS